MPNTPEPSRDRARGCLLGLAVGDAVGTTLEFLAPGTFEPIDDMIGGGPFSLSPGTWTDDTSMALCLAESLLAHPEVDPRDQADRYCRWWRYGENSPTGTCFDIGNTVRWALMEYEETGNPLSGSTDPESAGNGAIMRLAPVAMRFALDPDRLLEAAIISSRVTHGAATCLDACKLLASILAGLLQGHTRERVLQAGFKTADSTWEPGELCPEIEAISHGSYMTKVSPDIRGTGYVVESLEAALWAFHRAEDFRDAILRAVNLGDDADTTGAVAGQLAGAAWGHCGIPGPWLEKIAWQEEILALADGLFEAAQRPK